MDALARPLLALATMVGIRLQNVTVDFPVITGGARSIKHQLLQSMTGGRINSATTERVVVRALEDVTLSADHGDRIGLLGHNGAGKSTLLRVLARVYEPEFGAVSVQGRVAPLFDISLGMDMEATGYENIFLRGLYLGLRTREIRALVDEVVEFAELGEFLALPVRTYSSGMAMRLAFSISTAIRPDIVLMDEWLGTGDASFLHKAERRLHELIGSAGIMLLASHNDQIIRDACNKAILFEHGRIVASGEVDDVLAVQKVRTAAAEPSSAGADAA